MAPNFSISAEVQQESFGDQDVMVSFAKLGKGLGSFHWPTGNDLSTIARRSIVDFNLQFEPRGGGRYWFATGAKDIQKKYKKFQ